MLPADQPDLTKLVENLFANYARRPPDPATLLAWWRALKPFYLSDVSRAFERAIRENKTIPTPAHIIAIVKDRDAGKERPAAGSPANCTHAGCEADAGSNGLCAVHFYAHMARPPVTLILLASRMQRHEIEREPMMGPRMVAILDSEQRWHAAKPAESVREIMGGRGAAALAESGRAPAISRERAAPESSPVIAPMPDDYALAEDAWG